MTNIEKWVEQFNEECMSGKDLISNPLIVKDFIRILLQTEQTRIAEEVENIITRHINWKPTEGHGSDEERGYQKGLIAEAKLLGGEVLSIIKQDENKPTKSDK